MKTRKLLYAMIISGIFAVDQAIKVWIRKTAVHDILYRLDGILEITHCFNTGAAFSMMREYPFGIVGVTVVLLAVSSYYLYQSNHMPVGFCMAMSVLIGGGLGNFYDRIVYQRVTDYIRLLFIPFPVFNFADICITGSVVVLAIYILTERLDVHPET